MNRPIIICFKEIYSWNIFISSLVISSMVFVSSQHPDKYKVENITLQDASITTLLPQLQKEMTAAESDIFKQTVFNNEENNSFLTTQLSDSSQSTSQPSFINSVVLISSTIKSISISSEANSSVKFSVPVNDKKNYSALEVTTSNADLSRLTLAKVKNWPSSTVVTPFVTEQSSSTHYIIISISVLIIIALMAYGIYHYYRKEQVRRLRLQLMPVYNFDPTESDDWESNLLEEECNSLRQNKKSLPTVKADNSTSTSSVPLCQKPNIPVTYL